MYVLVVYSLFIIHARCRGEGQNQGEYMDLAAQIIKDIVAWIDSRIEKPLSIEDVARHSGYSKRHLQRLFNQHQSVCLGDFIREKKMQNAARDLRETTMTVKLISLRHGYTSQQTFTRIFTRRFSMPPGTYRRAYGSDHVRTD